MSDLESVKSRLRFVAAGAWEASLYPEGAARDALAAIEALEVDAESSADIIAGNIREREAQDAEIARLRNILGDETEVAHAMVEKAEEEIARLKAQVEHLGAVVKSMGRDYAALQSTTGGDASP